jgi:hypothetical protein
VKRGGRLSAAQQFGRTGQKEFRGNERSRNFRTGLRGLRQVSRDRMHYNSAQMPALRRVSADRVANRGEQTKRDAR